MAARAAVVVDGSALGARIAAVVISLQPLRLLRLLSPEADPKRLKQLAEETGGEAFRPRDVRQVTRLLPLIANQIRHSYTLGYAPTNTERSGMFRRIRVAAKSPTGEPLVVRTRTGYLAGPSR